MKNIRKYLELTKNGNKKSEQYVKFLEDHKNYLTSFEEIFLINKFETFKHTMPNKGSKESYLKCLQNLIRNSDIHSELLSIFKVEFSIKDFNDHKSD